MAGGAFTLQSGESKKYEGGITFFVFVTCVVAAMGGLLFGYDIGISGGVTSMEKFLSKFFPEILERMNHRSIHDTQYCKYDNQLLTLFTSSLYIAALVASFFASTVTRVFGRKISMFSGGLAFLAGALLNGFAANLEMLIIGRLLLGVGVGFANQSVPVYLSEMAPARLRGALNIGFQMAITIGILTAGLVNYATAKISGGWGWRLSLGLAGVPAAMMTLGSIFLSDTPNSFLQRGHNEEAKAMLQRIRGASVDIDLEFRDLLEACDAAKRTERQWTTILRRRYRPHLVLCVLIPFFQQITGINVIMFYAPVLFKTLGFADDASLMSAVITGSVICGGTVVSIFCVDRFGRKALFLEGGIQMFISQIAVGAMIAWKFGSTGGEATLTKSEADILVFLICSFVAAFAWSWGPLGWLVPSEICPLEIRSAGQAINVSVNMLFTALIAQGFLSMLCRLKFGLFFLFAGFVAIMTVFVAFFMPETKNVPIEEMNDVLRAHWFWRKYVSEEDGKENPTIET